jgi:hypothetical protein
MDESSSAILEGALRKGHVIHAFLSGGGLRVIRVEKERHGTLLGYGEHPSVVEALKHAAEDFVAGGRPYADVYGGPTARYAHYLTGSPSSNSELDAWLRLGNTFDARAEGPEFVVELKGMHIVKTPDETLERARANKGQPVVWRDRGYTYESVADSRGGVDTRVLKIVEGRSGAHGAWHYEIAKVGRAQSLTQAFMQALSASPVEERAPDYVKPPMSG